MGVSRARVLIRVPLPQCVGSFSSSTKYAFMGTNPPAGYWLRRPLQVGDAGTWDRRDFFWNHHQALLVEEGSSLPLAFTCATFRRPDET